ncbi:hypothetical protein ACNJX9_04535 [Bradyrhizobium sp. DASA03076]|uniref:hypothetical protein n=1 Tax=Bradyrhizobium sp. BLXBL-03 TaxID=3395916 RepID=UPI003F707C13
MNTSAIIEGMQCDRDVILERLSARISDLKTYANLQKDLLTSDVSKNSDYRRNFNRFYKMRSKPADWYRMFFDLLEREKHNVTLTFEDVIREIFARWGEVHPSFASKLVATINPECPVYDKEVCRNLGIRAVTVTNPERRLNAAIDNFLVLQGFHAKAKGIRGISELIDAFDQHFEQFVTFTAIKKLDLMLWQWRRLEN